MSIPNKLYPFILAALMFSNVNLVSGLSDKSRVAILTCEPGNELYTIFGHTTLRIQDSTLNIDNIYNFGTFDFSSPFFYVRFFGGRLDYFLTIVDYRSFLYSYNKEQRTIYEQTLDLTRAERDYLYNKLNQIYNSADRVYKYDFFYDNCATRIRDLFNGPNTSAVIYDTTRYCCKSFRELLKPFISNDYWINFGINLALGKEADKIAQSNDFMFLPEFVYRIFNDTRLIRETKILINSSQESIKTNLFSISLLIGVLILMLIVLFLPKTRLLAFYTINSVMALAGILLLVLSLFSYNLAFRGNYNICWTFPSLLVVFSKGKIRKRVESVFLVGLIVLMIFREELYAGFSGTFIPWVFLLIVMYVIDLQLLKRLKVLPVNRTLGVLIRRHVPARQGRGNYRHSDE